MIRAFQWDLARQVERLDWLLKQLPRYAEWGYQELYLHLEDSVTYPSFPGVARSDAYTTKELERLVAAAGKVGIGVVPIVNLLGHTQYLIKDPSLKDLNELRNPDGTPQDKGQLCPLHPRTLEVADRLIADMSVFATAGKLHVGLDESFQLGRHPLSQAEISSVGLATHFARYVNRLEPLVTQKGLKFGLWGDMLALLPEAIPRLPKGTAVYDWYYYPFGRLPRMELHNFREYDLAKPLTRAGGQYWGCAMNGAFRFEALPLFADRLNNILSWWRRCQKTKAEGFLVCSWEPNRLSMDMTVAVDAAAASLWLDRDVDDPSSMLARGIERAFKVNANRSRDLARLALACDERPFSGYSRWEINQRWDTTSTHDGVVRFEREERFFDRASAEKNLPEAFSLSLSFRRYIAERDVMVRKAVAHILRLRRVQFRHGASNALLVRDLAAFKAEVSAFASAIDEARKSANQMWALSRDPKKRGPNLDILDGDVARLKALLSWLGRVERNPAEVATASPVCGVWQLQFAVVAIEPALQKIVIEEESQPGIWKILHERFTIEFRATAARRQTKLRLEWSVPIDSPTKRLRIAVRGVGRVAIASVELTDGITRRVPKESRAKKQRIIGRPAPARGLPVLDWGTNQGAVLLDFKQA